MPLKPKNSSHLLAKTGMAVTNIGGDGSRWKPTGDGMRITGRGGGGGLGGGGARSTREGAGRSSYGACSRGPDILGITGSFIGGRTPSRPEPTFMRGLTGSILQQTVNIIVNLFICGSQGWITHSHKHKTLHIVNCLNNNEGVFEFNIQHNTKHATQQLMLLFVAVCINFL